MAVTDNSTPPRAISWVVMTGGCIVAVVASLLLISLVWFGSITSASAYLAGHRLIPDTFSKSFGTVRQGQEVAVTFSLTNMTSRTITILGTRSSCSCMIVNDLP